MILDQSVERLLGALYLPSVEKGAFTDECRQFLAAMALDRCNLQPPVQFEDLPVIANFVSRQGVPEARLIEWADENGLTGPVGAGIAKANRDACLEAKALLADAPDSPSGPPDMFGIVYKLADEVYGKLPPRDNGTKYADHPLRVEAMVLHGLLTVRNNHPETRRLITDPFVDAARVTARLHDAGEKDPGFSPIVVRYLLQYSGNPYGIEVASTLWLMNHYPKEESMADALSYDTYIRRGKRERLFFPAKTGDIVDNVINPKQTIAGDPKRAEKNSLKFDEYCNAWEKQFRHLAFLDRHQQQLIAPWFGYYLDVLENLRQVDQAELVRQLEEYNREPSSNSIGRS